MEWLVDPTAWAGLGTLVLLEIVLGIDNLIFIAILSDKLPVHERQRARIIGLSLALGMRLALLASISWMTTLTTPLFAVFGHGISGRDLILLVGGAFLLFKATMELHEKLEGAHFRKEGPVTPPKFWHTIVQIVVLDMVFSLDAVITAVGMSNHLGIMMLAVCIAMVAMILAANKLMEFVSAHQTVVVLCLGFLLMIGFSLMVEGLGYHIPKGYLYAAIGFSVLIEAFNQTAMFNRRKTFERIDPRTRMAQAVLGILSGKPEESGVQGPASAMAAKAPSPFKPQEQLMIQRVLHLTEQSVEAIMTPRHELYWIDLADPPEMIEQEIRDCPYSCLIVAENGQIEEPLGVLHKKDLADFFLEARKMGDLRAILRQPVVVPDSMTVLQTMEMFRKSRIHVAFVIDEYGTLEGFVTLTDVAEAIAGDLPEGHEQDDFTFEKSEDGSYLVSGGLTLRDLSEVLGPLDLPEGDYNTAAGVALNILKKLPRKGEVFRLPGWRVEIERMDGRRVDRMRFSKEESISVA